MTSAATIEALSAIDIHGHIQSDALEPTHIESGNENYSDTQRECLPDTSGSLLSVHSLSAEAITDGDTCTEVRVAILTSEKGISVVQSPLPHEVATFGSVKFLSPWIPYIDPNQSTWRTKRSRRKVVIWICFATAFTIFSLNLAFTVISWKKYGISTDAVATLYHGDCTFSHRLNTGLHFAINALSTLLLSSSNLCLQLLLAPTRAEVDRAHSQHRWLDIGVPSWRNFKNLSRWNRLVWSCLAVSSLPIHFLYNSVVFSTVSTNSYVYLTATEAFIKTLDPGVTFQLSNGTITAPPLEYETALNTRASSGYAFFGGFIYPLDPAVQKTILNIHSDIRTNLHLYDKLSNYDCLVNYSAVFDWRPHVLMISDNYDAAVEHNTSLFTWGFNAPYVNGRLNPISWTDDPKTDWQALGTISPSDAAAWADSGNRVQYCLRRSDIPGEKQFHECRVQCSPPLLLIVTIFNLVKCLSMLWLLYIRSEQTLCTLGDAVASFLEEPDPYTAHCGIATKVSIQTSLEEYGTWAEGQSRIWRPRQLRWYRAASSSRWWFTMLPSLGVLVAGTGVLACGLVAVKNFLGDMSFETLTSFGFGATDSTEIISWGQPTKGMMGLFANIVIANVWQVLLSLCYIAQNGILSCLLIADEWSGFASERKPLRVSHPRGIQRSTYFINMPMRYGIPIMVLFSLEHWLLSQSTFVIRVVSLDIVSSPVKESEGLTTSGYSITPAIIAVILPVLFIIAQLLNATVRSYNFNPAMPMVSTCSAAISANCQRPQADSDAHLLPVQWGVVEKDADRTQYCSFTTSRVVSPPVAGSRVLMMPMARLEKRNMFRYNIVTYLRRTVRKTWSTTFTYVLSRRPTSQST